MNVICMKWGRKYGPEYVNRLYGMVSRNLAGDFRFVCFTDRSEGIRPEVDIQALPEIDIPKGLPERGWRKLTVFAKGLGGLSGPALFLDLDVVIVDRIDCFFEYDAEFAIIHDKLHASRQMGNSSVFRFEIGCFSKILERFKLNFPEIRRNFRHEQAYLTQEVRELGKLQFWPDRWCPSFKYHCIPRWPISWIKYPEIPDGSKIIVFHGKPNPSEASVGNSGKWWRFIRPASWIREDWRE